MASGFQPSSQGKEFNTSEAYEINLSNLPQHILVKILSCFNYAETAELREVCQAFNHLCKMRLTDGFKRVDQYHRAIHKEVKSQLPRRESERHLHPLARHVNILSAVETRLSLLSMTFTKYIDSDLCCFIPGKVLDELFNILRSLQCVSIKPPRAHEFLQELRDISSMAMEHFDEAIVPILKQQIPCPSSSFNTSIGMFGVDADAPFGPMTSPANSKPLPSPKQDMLSLNRHLQTQKTVIKALKKGLSETKTKFTEQRKIIGEQDRKIAELTSKIERQDAKLADMSQKMLLFDKNFSDIFSVLPKLTSGPSSEPPSTEVAVSIESPNTASNVATKKSVRKLRTTKKRSSSSQAKGSSKKRRVS